MHADAKTQPLPAPTPWRLGPSHPMTTMVDITVLALIMAEAAWLLTNGLSPTQAVTHGLAAAWLTHRH